MSITANILREAGNRVVFHYGKVYVINLLTNKITVQDINSGRWMDSPEKFTKVTLAELKTHALLHIKTALENCYCNSLPGTTCDFCSGVRL